MDKASPKGLNGSVSGGVHRVDMQWGTSKSETRLLAGSLGQKRLEVLVDARVLLLRAPPLCVLRVFAHPSAKATTQFLDLCSISMQFG